MSAEQMAQWLERERLLAILRLEHQEPALAIVERLVEGGVTTIEFSLRMPGALEALSACVEEFGARARFGAGTVLSERQASESVDAGAAFLVSPNLDPEVVHKACELGVLHLPGTMSPTEIAAAIALGARLIKLFPARALGPAFIGDLLGPFPEARLVPTGGVSESNAAEFLDAGAVAVALGGGLVNPAAIDAPDDLAERARRLVEATRRS